ncbi:MAG: methionyl-tRNA formyltransferase [Ruminococcaceae bacterium]|nr:methionyl-tRNA formyltransferase [Oscillospiraceae bacterium]
MKIMFMGTPEISAIALKKLIEDGHDIKAVVTREDKPRGRGNVMTPTPTKVVALENSIPVYEPKTLKDEAFADVLKAVSPELIVVVAFGKILPSSVLEYPKYGCINLHVSLLPKYRGAAPMQRAIMNGESETGVTVMHMNEGLDTGDIISVEKFPIGPEDNFEDIHDKSALVGGELLSKTIKDIENGTAQRIKQNDAEATYAAKIEKSDAKIDFTKSAKELDFIIRGVTPIPGAFAYLNGKMLKIVKAAPIKKCGKAGEVTDVNGVGQGSFTVTCGEGALLVSSVIPEGKGKMSAGDFIRGRKIKEGDILE